MLGGGISRWINVSNGGRPRGTLGNLLFQFFVSSATFNTTFTFLFLAHIALVLRCYDIHTSEPWCWWASLLLRSSGTCSLGGSLASPQEPRNAWVGGGGQRAPASSGGWALSLYFSEKKNATISITPSNVSLLKEIYRWRGGRVLTREGGHTLPWERTVIRKGLEVAVTFP